MGPLVEFEARYTRKYLTASCIPFVILSLCLSLSQSICSERFGSDNTHSTSSRTEGVGMLELNIGVATGGSESSMNMCLHPPAAHTTRFTQHRVKYWPSEQKSLNEIALMPLEYIWYGEQSDFAGSLYPYF